MKAIEFIEYVKKEFSFLVSEFGFKVEKEIKDELVYGVLYKNASRAIQVYYEVLDQFSSVMIFRLKNGELPEWDDLKNSVPLHKISDFVHTAYQVDQSTSPYAFSKEFYNKNPVLKELNKRARSLKRVAKIILTGDKWISLPQIDKPSPPKVWESDDD